MGGLIVPNTTISGTAASPGIPVMGSPYSGFYSLPGAIGAGFSINGLTYSFLNAAGFGFGYKPVQPFAIAAIAGSPYAQAGVQPAVTPDGHFVYCSTGGTAVNIYSRNPVTNALIFLSTFNIAGSPNAPGSLKVSPDGLFLYAQAGSFIYLLSINSGTGALTNVASYAAGLFAGLQALDISADGLFLYASTNAGVAVYARNLLTGTLGAIAGSPFAAGASPFGLTITADGAHVIVANHGSANVSVFTRDAVAGGLVAVAGSPFAAGVNPFAVASSSDGLCVIVTNEGGNTISIFTRTPATGALAQTAGSPLGVGIIPHGVAFSPDGTGVAVTNFNSGTLSVFTRTPATNALAQLVGSPFAIPLGTANGLAFTPDGTGLYVEGGASLVAYITQATPTYNLLRATFDPLGGLGGALYLNGSLYINGVAVGYPAMPGNAGKFLRVDSTGTTTLWDGVNTYMSVAMVANAGAFAIDDTAEYIVEITGALTAQGALTPTFTVPADPLKIAFDNLTTGGFPLVLAGTYTLPPGRSYWYWNGATLELLSARGFRTANVTPLPAAGAAIAVNHLVGALPYSTILELVCLTAELGYAIGDVVPAPISFNVAAQNLLTWANTTQVGFTLAAGYVLEIVSKATGALATPTAANWAYRFVIEP